MGYNNAEWNNEQEQFDMFIKEVDTNLGIDSLNIPNPEEVQFKYDNLPDLKRWWE